MQGYCRAHVRGRQSVSEKMFAYFMKVCDFFATRHIFGLTLFFRLVPNSPGWNLLHHSVKRNEPLHEKINVLGFAPRLVKI